MEIGESATITVPARPRWVDTGVPLTPGEAYHLSATGTWYDRGISSGPEGYSSRNHLMRFAERWRRLPSAPWFALIGGIGRDPATQFMIGTSAELSPSAEGTLNCFANDLHFMYRNNEGSVTLTVTRER